MDKVFGKIPRGERISTLTFGAKGTKDDYWKAAFDKINELAPTLHNQHINHCSALQSINPRLVYF